MSDIFFEHVDPKSLTPHFSKEAQRNEDNEIVKNDENAYMDIEESIDTKGHFTKTITLDRIKIKTSSCNFIDWLTNYGVTTDQKERISERYIIKNPFNLCVTHYVHDQCLVVEFSSKILGDEYPKLISNATIRTCLGKLIELNICNIDVDGILEDAEVLAMDVTIDIPIELDKSLLKLLDEWSLTGLRYRENMFETGISFTNDAKDIKNRERLTFYNKGVEMRAKKNSNFRRSVKDSKGLISYFKGKTRIEYRMEKPRIIKKALGITSNQMSEVLQYDGNVICDIFNKIFTNAPKRFVSNTQKLKDWEKECVINLLNRNWPLIKHEVKKRTPKNSNSRKLKEYEAVFNNCNTAFIQNHSYEVYNQLIYLINDSGFLEEGGVNTIDLNNEEQ